MKDMEKELHEHHHHEEECECGCGCGHHHHDEEHEHHHDEECGCGCGCEHHHHEHEAHEHHHHHEEECGCGCGHHHHHDEEHEHHHDHKQEHEHHHHDEECECGCGCGHHHHHDEDHEHHHEAVEHEPCVMPAGVAQKTYILENLGCANCAAKMERKIQALPEVEGATLTYATKKLVVASDHQEHLLSKIQLVLCLVYCLLLRFHRLTRFLGFFLSLFHRCVRCGICLCTLAIFKLFYLSF